VIVASPVGWTVISRDFAVNAWAGLIAKHRHTSSIPEIRKEDLIVFNTERRVSRFQAIRFLRGRGQVRDEETTGRKRGESRKIFNYFALVFALLVAC
jgi:hypothetical protein